MRNFKKFERRHWLVLWRQVLKEPEQAEIFLKKRLIWSDSHTAFPANPKCSPCSCSPSWQLEGYRWVWRNPEGDDTEYSQNDGILMEKQEKNLLKLCFSPDAEWTMTFRKPYKPDDSSSGESNAEDVKQTVWNIYLLLKEGIILQNIPSLFMVIGMVWTVWSFTHELVSICSSSDVREKLLKPAWRQ